MNNQNQEEGCDPSIQTLESLLLTDPETHAACRIVDVQTSGREVVLTVAGKTGAWKHTITTEEVDLITEEVEKYIKELPWDSSASDHEKTLVAGNIRGFVGWWRGKYGMDLNRF